MPERKLLKIQEKGFWLVFWILFAAIFVQALIGMTLKEIAGEIVVLVVASIYIATASLKNGLWTRDTQPTIKSNLATSIIPALILSTRFIYFVSETNRKRIDSSKFSHALCIF